MRFSTAEINAMLNARFRSGTGSDWIGLSTTLPADDLSSGVTEPTGYSRVEMPRTSATWEPADLRQIVTASDVEWPAATSDWGVVEAWVIFDAATGGNPVIAGRLTGTDITTGDVPVLNAGSIAILAP